MGQVKTGEEARVADRNDLITFLNQAQKRWRKPLSEDVRAAAIRLYDDEGYTVAVLVYAVHVTMTKLGGRYAVPFFLRTARVHRERQTEATIKQIERGLVDVTIHLRGGGR